MKVIENISEKGVRAKRIKYLKEYFYGNYGYTYYGKATNKVKTMNINVINALIVLSGSVMTTENIIREYKKFTPAKKNYLWSDEINY